MYSIHILIIGEKRYELSENGKKLELVWKVDYEYDSSKHPFSDLKYYFNGESYVNNLLSKVLEEERFDYSYELRLNEYGYPETVYEKLGMVKSRIIRYSYVCP